MYLVIIRGPLGVGKSTISKALANRLHGFYISIDEILASNDLDNIPESAECIPASHFICANKIALPLIRENLENGRSVVVDGNFYHKEALDNLVESVSAANFIFTLKSSVETCIRRDSRRVEPHGKWAAIAVHKLVSRFDAGIVIETETLDTEQTLKAITQYLPN